MNLPILYLIIVWFCGLKPVFFYVRGTTTSFNSVHQGTLPKVHVFARRTYKSAGIIAMFWPLGLIAFQIVLFFMEVMVVAERKKHGG